MQPSDAQPPRIQLPDDVWISREEYERLRSIENSRGYSVQPTAAVVSDGTETTALRKQKRWQVIVGVILALALFWSVSSGGYANWILLPVIILFAGISFYDYRSSQQATDLYGVPVVRPTFKRNPYKILGIILLCVTIVPPLLLMGFFILLFSAGGGDMGS